MNTLPRPAAVLFDLDGTLVDTAPDFFGVVNELRQASGLAALSDEVIRAQVSNGGAALTRLTWEIDDQHPEFAAHRQQLLDCYEHQVGRTSALFDGFAAVLQQLQQQQIAWGIVTNKPRRYTELLLARMPLDCELVICPDDVSQAKPHPEPLLLAAQRLTLTPEQCWYLGDNERDIEAGRAAGMVTLGCHFGYLPDASAADHWGADAMLEHASDLTTLLTTYHQETP